MKTNGLSEKVKVERECRMCSKTIVLTLPRQGFRAWWQGAPIQKALPNSSLEEREILVSGLCSACYDAVVFAPAES